MCETCQTLQIRFIFTSCNRIRGAVLKLSYSFIFIFIFTLGVEAVKHVEHVMTRANGYAYTSWQEITACVPGCRSSRACWRELLPQLLHSPQTTLHGPLRCSLITYTWCVHISYVYENACVCVCIIYVYVYTRTRNKQKAWNKQRIRILSTNIKYIYVTRQTHTHIHTSQRI